VAGRDITEHLIQVLLGTGCNFPCIYNKAVMDDLKENLCFVNLEPDEVSWKRTHDNQRQYKLPDGNVIHIGENLCQVPEVIFEPD
jgi:hypothetical protein